MLFEFFFNVAVLATAIFVGSAAIDWWRKKHR